jgi:hypothetical protein
MAEVKILYVDEEPQNKAIWETTIQTALDDLPGECVVLMGRLPLRGWGISQAVCGTTDVRERLLVALRAAGLPTGSGNGE